MKPSDAIRLIEKQAEKDMPKNCDKYAYQSGFYWGALFLALGYMTDEKRERFANNYKEVEE
jgi:hypothetical protein